MVKVLITGAGGFIGSHLVESQLEQGHQVYSIDLRNDRLDHLAEDPNLEIVTGDITDTTLVAQLLDGVDFLYHLASAHLDLRLSDTHYWQVNVEGTKNLLQMAHSANVKRVIHCSSVGVFGEITNPPANETSPCTPNNVYEQTKLAGEKVALEIARQTGLPLVVARPAWVYGPRCPRTEKLLRTIRKGRFVMFGDGQTLRHPIYVADAVQGLELCLETSQAVGQVYIIAGETTITIAQLVRTVAEALEVPPPSIRLPVTLGKMAGWGLQLAFKPLGRQPPFSQRSMDFFLKDNAYDISKAKRELGFQPQVDLQTGLAQTLQILNS